MDRLGGVISSTFCLLALASNAPPATPTAQAPEPASLSVAETPRVDLQTALMQLEPPPPPPPPPPPTPEEAFEDGVLIVVSIESQQAFVFKRGELWDSTPVSTGKRGNETPVGEFPILQKKLHHRSNLYDDAPMPFMQRLTWDGVALHAGRVPGYPASHGCIRLPKSFAEKLYKITNFTSTLVMVTEDPITSAEEAREEVS